MPLRSLTEEHLALVLTWRNTPEVRRNMYSNLEISEEEHREWFSRIKHSSDSRWYVHFDANEHPDGVVYFTHYQLAGYRTFWGFYTAPASPPGTGTRLGLEALDEAFFVLKLHKLNAEVIGRNEASLRYHRKLGFQQEGVFRDFHYDGNSHIDVVRFGILENEWRKERETLLRRNPPPDK